MFILGRKPGFFDRLLNGMDAGVNAAFSGLDKGTYELCLAYVSFSASGLSHYLIPV